VVGHAVQAAGIQALHMLQARFVHVRWQPVSAPYHRRKAARFAPATLP
jgi:hypothetical protein